MTKKILLLSVLFLAFTCENSIEFIRPQPYNKKNLKSIPEKLQGEYKELADSTTLLIDNEKIVKTTFFNIAVSMSELDSTEDCILKNGFLICKSIDVNIPVNVKNDSIFANFPDTDTLFLMSEKQIIRKLGKYYFLNYLTNDSTWKVKVIKLSSDKNISISYLQKKDTSEIKNYTRLIKFSNENDSIIQHKIDPSVKELKKIIGAGLLRKKEFFVKYNN